MNRNRIGMFVLAGFMLCLSLLTLTHSSSSQPLVFCYDTQLLKAELQREIKGSGAEVSMAFQDLETGEFFIMNPVEMHAASLMKIPVMIEVFKQAENGKFSLDEKILVTNEFKSIVDGSLFSLADTDDSDEDIYKFIGKELSIGELVRRMITVSSNLATNVLIEFVGVDNIMGTLMKWEIQGMKVLRGVEDVKAYEQGLNNRTDAVSISRLLSMIAQGRAGTEEACQEMIEILSRQKYRNKIPARLPADVKVANKTGSVTRIDHDAAIVFPEGRKPYILVVMTRGIEKRADAEKLIADLSRIVYDHVTNKEDTKS